MLNKCDNCGQIVAATDSECWHCGQALTPSDTIDKAPGETAAVPDLSAILRYVGLTAVSLLLLILTTRAIGQAPLLRFGGNNTPLTGWQPITDSQRQFTLNLPDTWQAIDLTRNPTSQQISPLPALADSFAALVADSELLFLGIGQETAVRPPFALVARSQRLAQLTPEQYIAYAQQQLPETVEVIAADVTMNDLGITKGQIRFNLHLTENQWRCAHQFVPGVIEAYLITTCVQADQFNNHEETFAAILLSFQPLES